jgi:heavy metal sensor kinase
MRGEYIGNVMQSSIRIRLTAWYVGVLALTLLLLGSATYLSTRASLYHWLDETLGERAEALSEEVELVAARPRLELPDQGHGAYEGIGDGFLVLDGKGNVVLARGLDPEPFRRSHAVATAATGWPGASTVQPFPQRRWRAASHPILSQGKVAAVILVAHDLHELDEVMGRLLLVMTALLPLGLIGAGVGGYALANRALAPVDQITRTAGAISERDLSRRLVVGTPDELGRLAKTFNALLDRLQQAFERQRRFTADASHELRTPLSIIQALASQKLMRRRPPEEYEQTLRQIDEAAVHMATLVTHLLTLARADVGHVSLEREPLDLTELLEHVTAQVGEASGRAIPVRAPGPVRVVGDPMRLTELFLHLLENAVKYTPAAGSIEVHVSCHGGVAAVAVRDTGLGIPPEHLPHIFERFYRVDKARTRAEGGTGLGLAIGRWIAEAHGGSIRAESEPGRGTTITVTLPAGGEQNDR